MTISNYFLNSSPRKLYFFFSRGSVSPVYTELRYLSYSLEYT